ncbi:unnamed protein product [Amoebophrya sp. A120]|nr:unnamed protein product [Amoebophrya sp. A120]|eukprot:GSA120T00021191001.1
MASTFFSPLRSFNRNRTQPTVRPRVSIRCGAVIIFVRCWTATFLFLSTTGKSSVLRAASCGGTAAANSPAAPSTTTADKDEANLGAEVESVTKEAAHSAEDHYLHPEGLVKEQHLAGSSASPSLSRGLAPKHRVLSSRRPRWSDELVDVVEHQSGAGADVEEAEEGHLHVAGGLEDYYVPPGGENGNPIQDQLHLPGAAHPSKTGSQSLLVSHDEANNSADDTGNYGPREQQEQHQRKNPVRRRRAKEAWNYNRQDSSYSNQHSPCDGATSSRWPSSRKVKVNEDELSPEHDEEEVRAILSPRRKTPIEPPQRAEESWKQQCRWTSPTSGCGKDYEEQNYSCAGGELVQRSSHKASKSWTYNKGNGPQRSRAATSSSSNCGGWGGTRAPAMVNRASSFQQTITTHPRSISEVPPADPVPPDWHAYSTGPRQWKNHHPQSRKHATTPPQRPYHNRNTARQQAPRTGDRRNPPLPQYFQCNDSSTNITSAQERGCANRFLHQPAAAADYFQCTSSDPRMIGARSTIAAAPGATAALPLATYSCNNFALFPAGSVACLPVGGVVMPQPSETFWHHCDTQQEARPAHDPQSNFFYAQELFLNQHEQPAVAVDGSTTEVFAHPTTAPSTAPGQEGCVFSFPCSSQGPVGRGVAVAAPPSSAPEDDHQAGSPLRTPPASATAVYQWTDYMGEDRSCTTTRFGQHSASNSAGPLHEAHDFLQKRGENLLTAEQGGRQEQSTTAFSVPSVFYSTANSYFATPLEDVCFPTSRTTDLAVSRAAPEQASSGSTAGAAFTSSSSAAPRAAGSVVQHQGDHAVPPTTGTDSDSFGTTIILEQEPCQDERASGDREVLAGLSTIMRTFSSPVSPAGRSNNWSPEQDQEVGRTEPEGGRHDPASQPFHQQGPQEQKQSPRRSAAAQRKSEFAILRPDRLRFLSTKPDPRFAEETGFSVGDVVDYGVEVLQ